MRNAIALFASSVLVVVAAALPGHPSPLPQTHLSVTDIYTHPFETDLPYDQKLTLDLRSGDYKVTASTGEKFSVRTTGDRAEKGRDVSLTFKHMNTHAELKLTGGPTNRRSEHRHRGAQILESRRPPALRRSQYRRRLRRQRRRNARRRSKHRSRQSRRLRPRRCVRRRRRLSAPAPSAKHKDGLFRSFEKSGPGHYRLHAHVGAGDLNLK